MQISRLFQIIYILLEKKSVTAKELAENFEVSVRTIYRDIDALSEAGIPVYSTQGKGGGISLIENYVLNKSLLSHVEQDKILIALQSLTATGYPELKDTLSKLSSFFNKSNTNWIEVDFSNWGKYDKQKDIFNILRNSILENRVINFSYFNSIGEKSNRNVEPFKLLFKEKAWYLIGYCIEKSSVRTFKITRMADVYITEKSCTHADLQEFSHEPAKDFSTKNIKITLKISSEGAYRVYDEFQEKEIKKNEDGSYTVISSMPEGEWLYNYLLSFGTMLEVIAPENIRDEMAKRLNKLIAKYIF
ncbi:helix-turn-helix transcriptional regulator [Clostridium sp. 'White wine YQ']|uniref:helix-turn-helix transcriptional regulator n=1 Tax=Clostridium sp. 'White wine YQ' TaxID=3027474 RepID=UPI002367001B|nr:YafY family protein [Clostridium sp. 'White wine YQ']MDD7794737.1 YafY family protein [Clostridium sp. 'White wine YQ']